MDQHQKQAQEMAAKEQGAAIINAVKSEFDAYLQVHRVSAGLLPAPPPSSPSASPPSQQAMLEPPAPEDPAGSLATEQKADTLSVPKKRLLLAEFGHMFKLKDGSCQEFVKVTQAIWQKEDGQARNLKKTIDRIFKDYAPADHPPRARDARLQRVFEILRDSD